MRFKLKERPEVIYRNEFLIFPRKFDGYRYWLCWATIKYTWIGFRYQRFGEMVGIGKNNPKNQKTDV